MNSDDNPPFDEVPPDEPPGTDPAELERVIRLATESSTLDGPMFRLLMGARLWLFVPPHPELVSHYRDETEPLTWCSYKDDQGPFVPVFTSVRAADDRARMLPEPQPMMVELPARVLFAHLNSVQSTVLVIASNGATIRLPPEAVESLVKGRFTANAANTGERQTLTMQPLPAEAVPGKLRQAIRDFCAQRQGAMAVYVFNPVDSATGAVNERDLRVCVRLRDEAGHFCNDFALMVSRLNPEGCESSVAAARLDDKEGMAFLQRCTPLWPVVEA